MGPNCDLPDPLEVPWTRVGPPKKVEKMSFFDHLTWYVAVGYGRTKGHKGPLIGGQMAWALAFPRCGNAFGAEL